MTDCWIEPVQVPGDAAGAPCGQTSPEPSLRWLLARTVRCDICGHARAVRRATREGTTQSRVRTGGLMKRCFMASLPL